MADGPIQPVVQPITTDTMLSNNGLSIDDGLTIVTCEQTFASKLQEQV